MQAPNLYDQDLDAIYHQHAKTYLLTAYPRVNSFIRSPSFDLLVPSSLTLLYPLRKVFGSLSKLLCLTWVQLNALLELLEEDQWSFNQQLFKENSNQLGYLVVIHQVKNDTHYRQLTLYLLCAAIFVKSKLESQFAPALYAAGKLCSDFDRIYFKWQQYKNIDVRLASHCLSQEEYPNFSSLVDSLLLISPPYRTKMKRMNRAKVRPFCCTDKRIQILFKEGREREYRQSLQQVYSKVQWETS